MNKFKKILFMILVILFVLILYIVLAFETNIIDDKTYNFVSKFINDTNTVIFKSFTFLGSTLSIIMFCIISISKQKYYKAVIMNTIIVTIISQMLKFIIGRSRPFGIGLITETGYSFPSGHSMVSCAFYGFIIYLIYKSNMKKKPKFIFIFCLSAVIIMIGLSRIYLGVHYPTDVLAGYILAVIHLILFCELIYKKFLIKL